MEKGEFPNRLYKQLLRLKYLYRLCPYLFLLEKVEYFLEVERALRRKEVSVAQIVQNLVRSANLDKVIKIEIFRICSWQRA